MVPRSNHFEIVCGRSLSRGKIRKLNRRICHAVPCLSSERCESSRGLQSKSTDWRLERYEGRSGERRDKKKGEQLGAGKMKTFHAKGKRQALPSVEFVIKVLVGVRAT